MSKQNFKILAEGMTNTSQAPRGKEVYYLCTRCRGLISSQPKDNIGCDCGNVFIDIDYFRLAVRDFSHFKAVEKV